MKKIQFLIVQFLLFSTLVEAQSNLVGTFYGGWARQKGDYIWTNELGQNAQKITVADVDGDGFEDAISIINGTIEVALSSTYTNLAGKEMRHFSQKSIWINGLATNYDNAFAGDLNGDGLSDIAGFKEQTGYWEFSISNGTKFTLSTITAAGFGTGSSHQFFADVNNDAKDDLIAFTGGIWHVCINNGNGFNSPTVFVSNFGNAGATPFISDINNDGNLDAIYVAAGSIYVAKSNGTAFVKSASPWKTGVSGYTHIMFADVDGDKESDAILYYLNDGAGEPVKGEWKFCASNGTTAFGNETFWTARHGSRTNRPSKGLPACHSFFTGHVQQSKTSNFGVSPIAFNNDAGYWQVMPPYGMFGNGNYEPGQDPDWYCSWHSRNRGYLPLIGDEYYGFDAEDDYFAIQQIISDMAAAEIDFVLLDQSNTWGALFKTYQVFATAIMQWNANPANRKVRYAICGMFKDGPSQVETSARNTLMNFYNTYGTDNYQMLDDKPLLVCYGPAENKHVEWANYTGSKQAANKFTVKWMDGDLVESNIDPDNKGDWYGWQMVNGTIENDQQMVVQPGFYNGGAFISREKNGIEGDLYRSDWDKVLVNKPKDITIISLVGDPEQNDVFNMIEGEYTYGMGATEFWNYPEMYWEMTKDYIQNFRKLHSNEIAHIAEYGTQNLSGSSVTINFSQDFDVVPVVYASIKGTNSGRRIVKVKTLSPSSVTFEITGGQSNADAINWMAVKPGYWVAPNGMHIAAGSKSVSTSDAIAIAFDYAFESPPVLFSLSNTNANSVGCFTKQYSIQKDAFQMSTHATLGDLYQPETVGWIAIEAGKKELWSGRFCNALNPTVSQTTYQFTLPTYFYDDVTTLVKSSTGFEVSEGEPYVTNTTNLGGTIKYQDASTPQSDILNILSFDGSGGGLYGAIWDANLHVATNSLEKGAIKISPNPVNDTLYVHINDNMEKTEVTIFNMTGLKVKTAHISIRNNSIDVSQLIPGNYVLEALSGQKKYNSQFIKL